jgi:hypothetical protein
MCGRSRRDRSGHASGLARIALAYDPAIRPGGFASADIRGTVRAPLLPESALQADHGAMSMSDGANKASAAASRWRGDR